MKKVYGLLSIVVAMWAIITWSRLSDLKFALRAELMEGYILDWEVRTEVVQHDIPGQRGAVVEEEAVPYVNVMVLSGPESSGNAMRCSIVGAYDIFGTSRDYSRPETEAKLEVLQRAERLPLYVLLDEGAVRCSLHRFVVEGPLVFMWSALTAVLIWLLWGCFMAKRSEEMAT